MCQDYPEQRSAYNVIAGMRGRDIHGPSGGTLSVTVTGPLQKSGCDYVLEVRKFSVA